MLYTLLFFVLGAAFGSFSLVLAWRMHDKKDWVAGRSACDKCGHLLQPRDLIPVISWISLKGRCRYCKKSMPASLLMAELLLGSVFALSWFVWELETETIINSIQLAIWLISSVLLSALFWYDLRWYKLPTKIIVPLSVLASFYVVFNLFSGELMVFNDLIYPVASGLVLSAFFWTLFSVSGGKWIGFGDVRLAVPLGFFLGSLLNVWLMVFFASLFGIIFALPSLVRGSRKLKSHIPFGPLLILATWTVVLYGQKIADAYTDFIGI